jgi:uncharacterized protein YceK
MMYRQALLLVLILLTGCSSIEKQAEAEKKQDKAEQAQMSAAEAAIDDTKCQSFGYKRDTAAYAQCRKDYEAWHKQLGINSTD